MNEINKLVLTFTICALTIFGWKFFVSNDDNNTLTQTKQEQVLIEKRDDIVTKNKNDRILINSNKLSGSILLKGLRFDDLSLLEFKENIDLDEKVNLLNPVKTKDAQVISFGWVSPNNNIILPNDNTVWSASSKELTPSNPVTLTWNSPQNILFKLEITMDENYIISISQLIENRSAEEVVLSPYGLVAQYKEKDVLPEKFAVLHQGFSGVFSDILKEVTYEDIRESKKVENANSSNGWVSITDKYWLAAVVPDQRYEFNSSFNFKNIHNLDKYQADFVSQQILVKPKQTLVYLSYIYAGAKNLKLLDDYEKKYDIPKFDLAVDFGWLYFITKPMLICLQLFHKITGSFGVSILMLTVVIKLIMFPLANKSFASMSKMKKLSPTVSRLQEKYADDKLKFNQELMELYKNEKINPLSGCLPMLVQIPVFFALYKVFFVSVEMRHTPFLGWIKDLSAPDPTSMLNLFGLAPWNAPEFLHIGILPILMGVTMFIQQMLNPKSTDPVQDKVMKIMPFAFIFMFYKFSAGLVLYWVWNNILSIAQQYWIQKKTQKSN